MDMGGAPMGDPMMDGGMPGPEENAPVPGGDPMGGQDPMGGEDVEMDPKKDIQKLTGELSQKLRLYNDENNDPELSKYVAGMIMTQAGKNLDGKGKKEVVKKMNGAEEEMEDMAMEGGDENGNEAPQGPEPQMECERKLNGRISETFNTMIYGKERGKKRPSKEIKNRGVDNNNPFIYR